MRILAHPEPIVDLAANVRGEMTIDVAADGVLSEIGINYDTILHAYLRRLKRLF